MTTTTRTLARACILLAFVAGIGIGGSGGCEKNTNSPDDGGSHNLCTEYNTCDECIAGQQRKGKNKGTAETECGAAVTGCWTTWEKPVVCSGKEHAEP